MGVFKETKGGPILRMWTLKIPCVFLYQDRKPEKRNNLMKKLQKPIRVRQNPTEESYNSKGLYYIYSFFFFFWEITHFAFMEKLTEST